MSRSSQSIINENDNNHRYEDIKMKVLEYMILSISLYSIKVSANLQITHNSILHRDHKLLLQSYQHDTRTRLSPTARRPAYISSLPYAQSYRAESRFLTQACSCHDHHQLELKQQLGIYSDSIDALASFEKDFSLMVDHLKTRCDDERHLPAWAQSSQQKLVDSSQPIHLPPSSSPQQSATIESKPNDQSKLNQNNFTHNQTKPSKADNVSSVKVELKTHNDGRDISLFVFTNRNAQQESYPNDNESSRLVRRAVDRTHYLQADLNSLNDDTNSELVPIELQRTRFELAKLIEKFKFSSIGIHVSILQLLQSYITSIEKRIKQIVAFKSPDLSTRLRTRVKKMDESLRDLLLKLSQFSQHQSTPKPSMEIHANNDNNGLLNAPIGL